MTRKKKRIRIEESDGSIYTFSSIVALLLAFFVFLYSFSTVDSKRFKEISNALKSILNGQNSDNILKNGEYSGKIEKNGKGTELNVSQTMYENENIIKKIQNFVEENNLSNYIDVIEDPRGVTLQLKDSLLFEAGRSDLIGSSKITLDKISELLAILPNSIIVEGHTDNTPISTYKFESNWELSASRAINVVRYFTEVKKLNSERFSAAGYGEHKPLVDNDTTENRAKNRRINILILSMEKERE